MGPLSSTFETMRYQDKTTNCDTDNNRNQKFIEINVSFSCLGD